MIQTKTTPQNNFSLSNHLLSTVPNLPPSGAIAQKDDMGSRDSKYSMTQNPHTYRGAEPPPPTTQFLNCGCIKSTLKFGIPFIIVISIGACLNWILTKDDQSLDIPGAFIQTWIPILFILFYLRWRYFRVVLTIELFTYFIVSLVCVFPYAFGLVFLSDHMANKWDVFDQSMAQWLTIDRFFMLICNSCVFVAFATLLYKIIFIWLIHTRQIIACPTALMIYSVVISSSSSSMIDALYIINQDSVWVGIIIVMISLPINIGTGVYVAMFFSTKRFANQAHSHERGHAFSIDSMDITIEYDTKKNQMSSKFTFASHSRKTNKSTLTVTQSSTAKQVIKDSENEAFDFDEDDSVFYNGQSHTTYNQYSDIDQLHGKAYIINLDKRNGANNVFRPYSMFMICWVTHSLVQVLITFIDALFRECYPTKIFLEHINDGKEDDIKCKHNTVLWLILLWTLVFVCVLIAISFIGYIRHLWLLYFKDGTKVNVHYLLMCNQVKSPNWCKCCYFCEIRNVFDEYGVLLSSVRETRLSSNEKEQYEQMKHRLENIT